MEISTSALPTVAAERATMFVALELSKSIWLVALHSPISDKVSQHRFAGGDVDGLLALIARKQAQAEARLGRAIRILSCYEAGYDGFWLHRLLCARGIDNRVLDAASILVDRRSRRAKTDRLDAAGLLRTLMALDRGESRVCRVVRVPSVAQEDERRRSRERGRLVVERGQHSSRIKGLLMTIGVRDFEPARRDWQLRLDGLRAADGQALPPYLKAEITRECRRLHQVIEMIAEIEAEQEGHSKPRRVGLRSWYGCAASGWSARRCWSMRCSSATSATAGKLPAISAWHRAHGRAVACGATKE